MNISLFCCREAVVISVKNVSGIVSVDEDGNWICTGKHNKTDHIPNPVSYFFLTFGQSKIHGPSFPVCFRGLALAKGWFVCFSMLTSKLGDYSICICHDPEKYHQVEFVVIPYCFLSRCCYNTLERFLFCFLIKNHLCQLWFLVLWQSYPPHPSFSIAAACY